MIILNYTDTYRWNFQPYCIDTFFKIILKVEGCFFSVHPVALAWNTKLKGPREEDDSITVYEEVQQTRDAYQQEYGRMSEGSIVHQQMVNLNAIHIDDNIDAQVDRLRYIEISKKRFYLSTYRTKSLHQLEISAVLLEKFQSLFECKIGF